MKRWIWRIHSTLGLFAGLGLLVIGLTGSLLVFRAEIDALVAPKVMRAEPTPQGRLPWSELTASAEKAWPGWNVAAFGPRGDPALADLVYLEKEGAHEFRAGTLNQYTGEAQSGPMKTEKTFTGVLLELHYTWFADHPGMLVTGTFGVLLCLLGISGVWIYRGFWRSMFTIRWRRGARILFSDVHKFTGITSTAFNLVLGFTGAYWNLTHVAAEGLADHAEEAEAAHWYAWNRTLSLDELAESAGTSLPGFRPYWISFPGHDGEPITFWGRTPGGNILTSDYSSRVDFDAQSGAVTAAEGADSVGAWMAFVDTFRALHYGTFGGLPVKILWSVFALAPGVLAVTGFLIWFRRRRKRKA